MYAPQFSLLHLLLHIAIRVKIRVSNGTGHSNFSGQRDRSFFIVPGQRDNGTSSKSCHGTGRDGILNRLSRPVPGRPGTKALSDWQKNVKKSLFSLLSRGCPAGQENPVPLEALIVQKLYVFCFCFV